MHFLIGIDANNTDGNDPMLCLANWLLDGTVYQVSNALTRREQLLVIYQLAGHDVENIDVQRMIDYRETFGADAFMEAVVEQLIAICDDQKIPLVESFATIVGLRDAVKEKHPKTNK